MCCPGPCLSCRPEPELTPRSQATSLPNLLAPLAHGEHLSAAGPGHGSHHLAVAAASPDVRCGESTRGAWGPREVGSRAEAVTMDTAWLLETAGETRPTLTAHFLPLHRPPCSGKGVSLSELPLFCRDLPPSRVKGGTRNTPHGASWTGPQGPGQSPRTAGVRCSSGTGRVLRLVPSRRKWPRPECSFSGR